MRCRALVMMLVAASLVTIAPFASAATGDNAGRRCVFRSLPTDPQLDAHAITYRKGLSCAQAKAVLRELKGDAPFIPMACMEDLTLDGWHLRNLDRDSAPIQQTQYRRGRQIINYTRYEDFDTATCIPPGGFVFDGM